MTRAENSRTLSDERGGVLVVVLVVAALGTLLVGSLITSMIEAEVSGRDVLSSQAFYHAEAGVQHALAVIVDGPTGLDDDLVGPDGVAGTEDDGYILGMAPITVGDGTYLVRLVNNWDAACTGGEAPGSEEAQYCDSPDPVDSDGIAHLWVVGTSGDSTGAIRATIDLTAGKGGGPGIYTNGTISSGSGSTVIATDTTIHGNGGLRLDRNSDIYGLPGTSGEADVKPGTSIDGESLSADEADAYEEDYSGLSPIEIPEINASDYSHLTDYRLTADGKVFDSVGDEVASGDWNSWKFQGGEWKLNSVSGSYEAATLYFETDVSVTAQDQITATILTEGSVSMNGGSIESHKENLLIVADGDVRIGGNADSTAYVGNIYVREQIQTFGNSGLHGSIIAQDAASDHNLVRGDAIQLSSMVVVDPTIGNPIMQEAAGIADWYPDHDARFRTIFP